MSISETRFIKRCAEFCPREELNKIPSGTRGIYVLLNEIRNLPKKPAGKPRLEVVYIGLASGRGVGVKSRLRSHRKNKKAAWTHFSVYEVWDNITEDEVAELEGLFRHIYRRDPKANRINRQRLFKKLKGVQENNLRAWHNPNHL